MKPTLTIIGGGMGDPALLTGEARIALEAATRLYAPIRLADSLKKLNPVIQPATLTQIREALAASVSDAAVVVSGDAGFFSLSTSLSRNLEPLYSIRILNGLSSLQYFCGRLGFAYDGVKTLSLHGRTGSLAGPVSYHRRIFALTGGENSVAALLAQLCRLGLGHVTVWVGERLSQLEERLTTGAADQLQGKTFDSLAALLVENPQPCSRSARLRDGDFLRGETPMTKEPVRNLSVARLAVEPDSVVWDIGAGTGSVSVALARAACDGMVYAVERNATALELIRANRDRLGAHNLTVVEAEAPQGLEALPTPDKVFLGGTGGGMDTILRWLTKHVSRFDVCINAITLESVHTALDCLTGLGFADVEVECVNVARGKTVGGYHMMTGENPVHILSGRWLG